MGKAVLYSIRLGFALHVTNMKNDKASRHGCLYLKMFFCITKQDYFMGSRMSKMIRPGACTV